MPLDSQIFGSVAAASDGREVFAASAGGIFQVFDDGDHGRRGWTAALDLYDVPPDLTGYGGMNLLLTGVGANGLLIQAGVGLRTGTQSLPVRTGIVHVDRLTGAPRWFADGLEESLGAMSTGPDGALYLPHAPLRRAFSLALGLTTEPLVGGVSKWASTRRRPARARRRLRRRRPRRERGRRARRRAPTSAIADLAQVDALRVQMLDAADRAVSDGALDAGARRPPAPAGRQGAPAAGATPQRAARQPRRATTARRRGRSDARAACSRPRRRVDPSSRVSCTRPSELRAADPSLRPPGSLPPRPTRLRAPAAPPGTRCRCSARRAPGAASPSASARRRRDRG